MYLGSVFEDLNVIAIAGVSPRVVTAISQALRRKRSEILAHKKYWRCWATIALRVTIGI